ncbi:hypothetical protein E2C01_091144 [Portunus trituberculatus]|uniref:Uncharacterized protein n=1 Tax=Portunus trituberculatus TaxID=210409 RepID=A0A5B7JMS6_PORTR|nr:hypothetical protein [Portunus trituberculatus]
MSPPCQHDALSIAGGLASPAGSSDLTGVPKMHLLCQSLVTELRAVSSAFTPDHHHHVKSVFFTRYPTALPAARSVASIFHLYPDVDLLR